MGILERLKAGLRRSRSAIAEGLTSVLSIGRKLDADTAAGVEEVLISADIAPRLAVEVLDEVKYRYKRREISDPDEVIDAVRDRLKEMLPRRECEPVTAADDVYTEGTKRSQGRGRRTMTAGTHKGPNRNARARIPRSVFQPGSQPLSRSHRNRKSTAPSECIPLPHSGQRSLVRPRSK